MSANSNSIVPYSRYRALQSQGRVAFLRGVPIIGGFVFVWACNKALDEGWEATKRRFKDAEPTQPDYAKLLAEEQARVREEQARNRECAERLKEANARIQHFEQEKQRTVFTFKWPW
jgi:hypothetical protein